MKLSQTSTIKKKEYIVWVEGDVVYEGNSKSQANHVYEIWLSKGYDDVQIEEFTEYE